MNSSRFDRLETKVDSVLEHVSAIRTEQAAVNERGIAQDRRMDSVESDLEPIKRHVSRMEGSARLLALLAIVFGIIEVVARFILPKI